MSRRYPRPVVPAAAIADDAHRAMATLHETEEPGMKIQFASVQLREEIPRLASDKGLASSTTSFFDTARSGVTIELDTATSLVRLSKGAVAIHIPLHGVRSFGDVVLPRADVAKTA